MNGRKLAFLGLGVMGYPMAGHLAKAGHDVTVHARDDDQRDLPGARTLRSLR